MSIEGRVSVDVSFSDIDNSSNTQSLKRISLVDTTSYTTGKVAILSGTVGTSSVAISISPTTYRDASGAAVSFTNGLSRIAFAATPLAFLEIGQALGGGDNVLASRSSQAIVADGEGTGAPLVYTTAGTASYTLVLYGT